MFTNQHLSFMNVPLPEDLQTTILSGDHKMADAMIESLLKRDIAYAMRARLEAERLFLKQIRKVYTLTQASLIREMQESIPDFSQDDVRDLLENGWLDSRIINGERLFMEDVPASLLKANPQIAMRAGKPLLPENPLLDDAMQKMKEWKELSFQVEMNISLKIKDQVFTPGTLYKVHLPLPRNAMSQQQISLIDCKPNPRHVALANAPQRTVYFEETLQENTPFSTTFRYTQKVRYADIIDGSPFIVYPDAPPPSNDDLSERLPHIVFTPYLKALAQEIKGDEVLPIRIVKRIYDWITTHVRYAYQRPYLLIENGAEYTASGLKGDCGLQALLFIALCRILKIPARWESGLYATPTYIGSHDWAQFYTEQWGWLPADCSFGGSAFRHGNEERRRFYLGNLDPYRLAANSTYYAPFTPDRTFLRNDPYDNQRGEVETDVCGLESNDYQTTFTLNSHSLNT